MIIIDLRREYQKLKSELAEATLEVGTAREALEEAEDNVSAYEHKLTDFTRHGKFDDEEEELDNLLPSGPWLAGFHLLPQSFVCQVEQPDLFGVRYPRKTSYIDVVDSRNQCIHGRRDIITPNCPTGEYKFVLLAVRQDVPKPKQMYVQDDYGNQMPTSEFLGT